MTVTDNLGGGGGGWEVAVITSLQNIPIPETRKRRISLSLFVHNLKVFLLPAEH